MKQNFISHGGCCMALLLATQLFTSPVTAIPNVPQPEVVDAGTEATTTYQFKYSIHRQASSGYDATQVDIPVQQVNLLLGLDPETSLLDAINAGKITFFAVEPDGTNNEKRTANGVGQWFDAEGKVINWGADCRIYSEFNGTTFNVGNYTSSINTGDQFTFTQGMKCGKYTVLFTVEIVMDTQESLEMLEQPDKNINNFVPDGGGQEEQGNLDVNPVDTLLRVEACVNEQPYELCKYVQVQPGDNASFRLSTLKESKRCTVSWRNPEDKIVSRTMQLDLKDLSADDAGWYKVTARVDGVAVDFYVYIDVLTEKPGTPYDWTKHTPHFAYNYKQEFPSLEMPEKILNDVEGVVTRQTDRWWTFVAGKNKRKCVTEAAITPMLEKFNEDFAFIRDEMGWPPDKRAKRGYKSTICMYGSGLNTDAADSTALGGWQGATYYQGESWPMVLISYYPIYCFDPDCPYTDKGYQTEAMIHEGIHALLADLPGCKQSAWFQEGGNTWLQAAMATRRTGKYGTPGFLDGGPFLAPFMPIECYSGWLNDGSFGGPSAEGVNMFNGSQQICTWRTYLGGVQYSNAFPSVLAGIAGDASIPWIWRYCPGRVLEGIADSIGNRPMRSLILQYRSRTALFDFGGASDGFRQVASGYFGNSYSAEFEPYNIKPEPWYSTPYAKMTLQEDGWLKPEARTNPGWSGANQIPIHVSGDTCSIDFEPRDPGMMAILCYKTASGNTYYSQPAYCGTLTLAMPEKPANGVVFAVVANTEYKYGGEEMRKKHYDYRIRLGKNAWAVAAHNKKWFMNEQKITDPSFVGINEAQSNVNASENGVPHVRMFNGMLHAGDWLNLSLEGIYAPDVKVHIMNVSGVVVEGGRLNGMGTYQLPANLPKGLNFIAFTHNGIKDVYKVIIE